MADSPTRRAVLVGLGTSALAVACSTTDSNPTGAPTTTTTTVPAASIPATSGNAASELTAADFDTVGSCSSLPPSPAGPFGLREQFVRRDVTEGYPGHPLRLGLRVADDTCAPFVDAEVEIWHADATGDYSAFSDNGTGKDEAEGTTFLRGTQTTDADGIVMFETIVPGWYPGRAVHIHITVRRAEGGSRTGQLFFDESFLGEVYAEADYRDNGTADTTNAADAVAAGRAADTVLHTAAGDTARGAGTVALLNLSV